MAKPVLFGKFNFRTKRSAIEEVRRRINKYDSGDCLDVEDELFFASLFTLHSEYEDKKGAGIDCIMVERDFHNNKCLFIHRIDGSKIDCSWTHCIQPASKKTIVLMSFRRAVKEIVSSFKRERLTVVKLCPEFGTELTIGNCHASYLNPSFERLVDDFLSRNDISYDDIELIDPSPQDDDQRGIIASQEITQKWIDYHYKNASITLLSKEANLRRVRR